MASIFLVRINNYCQYFYKQSSAQITKFIDQSISQQQMPVSTRSIFKKLADAKGKRIFLNPEQISSHLKCRICSDVFEDPVRITCGHSFCYICIQNWAIINKKCETCKKPIKKKVPVRNLIAYNIIDDLPVRCIYKDCKWRGLHGHLKKHQRKCEFRRRDKQNEGSNQVDIDDSQSQAHIVIQVTPGNDNSENQDHQ